MEKADILIKDGILVTVDPDRRIFRGSIAIQKNRIVSIGKTSDVTSKFRGEEVLEAKKMVVLPGLINMHNHIWSSIIRGLRATEGMKIDDLLKTSWAMQESMEQDQFYAGALLTCAENIKNGVTAVAEHTYPFHRLEAAESTLKAFEETGIRAAFARGIMTIGYEPICEDSDTAFRATARLIERYRNPMVQIMIAPVSFRQAEPDDYRKARELAEKYKVRLYTHVAETHQEIEGIKSKTGKRPIEFLHELGFTGHDVTLVHCVYLSDEEIELLAKSGTSVVHCPSNNMKLAKGVTAVPKLLAAGVRVGLGTDSPSTGRQDMLAEISAEVLMQSLHNLNPTVMTSYHGLEMATINGAAALGLQNEIGSLENGKKADIILLDFDKLQFTPLIDVVQSIVYYSNGSDVDTVIIDGRIVMKNRKLLTVDEGEVKRKVIDASREYVARIRKEDLIGKY